MMSSPDTAMDIEKDDSCPSTSPPSDDTSPFSADHILDVARFKERLSTLWDSVLSCPADDDADPDKVTLRGHLVHMLHLPGRLNQLEKAIDDLSDLHSRLRASHENISKMSQTKYRGFLENQLDTASKIKTVPPLSTTLGHGLTNTAMESLEQGQFWDSVLATIEERLKDGDDPGLLRLFEEFLLDAGARSRGLSESTEGVLNRLSTPAGLDEVCEHLALVEQLGLNLDLIATCKDPPPVTSGLSSEFEEAGSQSEVAHRDTTKPPLLDATKAIIRILSAQGTGHITAAERSAAEDSRLIYGNDADTLDQRLRLINHLTSIGNYRQLQQISSVIQIINGHKRAFTYLDNVPRNPGVTAADKVAQLVNENRLSRVKSYFHAVDELCQDIEGALSDEDWDVMETLIRSFRAVSDHSV